MPNGLRRQRMRSTEAELRSAGRMGFSEEEYRERLRRRIERREDIQAHEMALAGMRETGAGRRLGITEAGLGRRAEEEREYARPLRAAEVGRVEAEAGRLGAVAGETRARTERERYSLGFERGLEPTLEDIVKQKKRYGELDIEALELGLRGGRARPETPEVAAPAAPAVPEAPVEEKRKKRRPWLKGAPWGSTEPLFDLTDWLRRRVSPGTT